MYEAGGGRQREGGGQNYLTQERKGRDRRC